MELMEEYIKTGRIKLDTHKYHATYTVHDPCNYVRKSQMAFGKTTGDKIPLDRPAVHRPQPLPEMCEDSMNNLCCGAGGGAWAMPYDEERLAYGRMKADQIKDTGAEIVVAPCHNCRDQIMKGLTKDHDMGNYKETLYLWELVSLCLDYRALERRGDRTGHAARDAQFERDGIELEEEE